jgi:hypothetical protein
MKAEFKAFFDEQYANTEWDWNQDNGSIVLVDAVFNLDDLIKRLLCGK